MLLTSTLPNVHWLTSFFLFINLVTTIYNLLPIISQTLPLVKYNLPKQGYNEVD